MKRNLITLSLGIFLASCSNSHQATPEKGGVLADTITQQNQDATQATVLKDLDWASMPELKNIGDFPFFTAPSGFKILNENQGVSELFEFEKMENLTAGGVYTAEGKLGILAFEGTDGSFNQRLFDRSIYDYTNQIGANELYKGAYPENDPKNEAVRNRLKENMWSGKHRTTGLADDSPFAVYAFRNKGKKYIVQIQSNSAGGRIYVMELKDFEQTMVKYSAEKMKKDIDANGKAILSINFDIDKATLQPDGQKTVNEILILLQENQSLNLSIEGHTDNTGNIQRNKELSGQRANTVLAILSKSGISKSRLKAVGYGSEKPLNKNDTEEGRAQNRRVEIVKF